MVILKMCKWCKTTFVPKSEKQLFCSGDCRLTIEYTYYDQIPKHVNDSYLAIYIVSIKERENEAEKYWNKKMKELGRIKVHV